MLLHMGPNLFTAIFAIFNSKMTYIMCMDYSVIFLVIYALTSPGGMHLAYVQCIYD